MEKFDNFTCGRIDLMGDIVTKSAPYLYPFLIEFSLIGAGVLLIMWARIGKNPRCNLDFVKAFLVKYFCLAEIFQQYLKPISV